MKSLWILPAAALLILGAERPAHADAMLDPCMMMGKMAGDPCITIMSQPGTCVQGPAGLICQPTASSSSSSGSASSSSASGSASSSSASGSGSASSASGSGSGSGSGTGGAGGGSTSGPGDNGSCSCRTGVGADVAWGGLSLLVAIPLLAYRRRRR